MHVLQSKFLFAALLTAIAPVFGPYLTPLSESPSPAMATQAASPLLVAQGKNGKEAVDGLFQTMVDHGFLITLGAPDKLKTEAELREPDQVMLKVTVTIKASDAVQQALETTARDLGGLTLDAIFEGEFGMAPWWARAVRVSDDPKTLEYFQHRVASLVFLLRLILDNGSAYECVTGNLGRLPIAPVRELFAYGGKPSIQGLGVSPAYDTKDYGFISVRKQPINFLYRAVIPAADLQHFTKLEGRVLERKGVDPETECKKTEKAASTNR